MIEIIFSGFGGQGVLTSGLILAKIAMDSGKNVTWIPSYGSEMRGGTANCSIKIDDKEISSPLVSKLDVLVAMNEPSVHKFAGMLKENGLLIVNSSIVKDMEFRDDIEVLEVPANDIAKAVDNERGSNIVSLGALIGRTKYFEKEFFQEGIEDFFANKGKNNPLNRICFEKGYELVKTGI